MGLAGDNPMAKVLLSVLIFEAVVFGLAIAGLINVEQLPVLTASLLGGAGALLALVAAGALRTPLGYPLAWLTQLAAVGFGFLTPMMFAVGGMFALLWVLCFGLGRRLERNRLSTGNDETQTAGR